MNLRTGLLASSLSAAVAISGSACGGGENFPSPDEVRQEKLDRILEINGAHLLGTYALERTGLTIKLYSDDQGLSLRPEAVEDAILAPLDVPITPITDQLGNTLSVAELEPIQELLIMDTEHGRVLNGKTVDLVIDGDPNTCINEDHTRFVPLDKPLGEDRDCGTSAATLSLGEIDQETGETTEISTDRITVMLSRAAFNNRVDVAPLGVPFKLKPSQKLAANAAHEMQHVMRRLAGIPRDPSTEEALTQMMEILVLKHWQRVGFPEVTE